MPVAPHSNSLPESGSIPRCLLVLCFVFLVLMAGAAFFVQYHSRHLADIESTTQSTAVGDISYFIPSTGLAVDTPVLAFHQTSLLLAFDRPLQYADSSMRAIGRDDSKRFFLYQAQDDSENLGPNGEVFFFVKYAPGQYLKLVRPLAYD